MNHKTVTTNVIELEAKEMFFNLVSQCAEMSDDCTFPFSNQRNINLLNTLSHMSGFCFVDFDGSIPKDLVLKYKNIITKEFSDGYTCRLVSIKVLQLLEEFHNANAPFQIDVMVNGVRAFSVYNEDIIW